MLYLICKFCILITCLRGNSFKGPEMKCYVFDMRYVCQFVAICLSRLVRRGLCKKKRNWHSNQGLFFGGMLDFKFSKRLLISKIFRTLMVLKKYPNLS